MLGRLASVAVLVAFLVPYFVCLFGVLLSRAADWMLSVRWRVHAWAHPELYDRARRPGA